MATQSFEQLIAGANKIKANALPESNTAVLVGEQLLQMANKQSEEHTERVNAIKAESDARLLGVTEYNVSVHHPNAGIGGTNKFTLAEAIKLIPQELRRVGIKCSFVDDKGMVCVFEYQGGMFTDVAAWIKVDGSVVKDMQTLQGTMLSEQQQQNSQLTSLEQGQTKHTSDISTLRTDLTNVANEKITKERLSEPLKQYIESAGGGSITNNADDEDLTVVDGALKFKDKEFNAASFSGKGRKILRKNLVQGKNVLTQGMFNKPNTIYVIRYDYQLNGATLTIPQKCTLYFDGGSISGGNIVFADTLLIGELDNIFSLGTLNDIGDSQYNLTGTIKNRELSLDWFIANNDADALQYALNCSNDLAVPLVLGNKRYNIEHTIFLPNFVCIFGNSYHPNMYGGNGVNNTSILSFSCRYLFMPKRRMKGDGKLQSDSERFMNDIKMTLMHVSIMGQYSCPEYPSVGYHNGHAAQPYNGDIYWIRKTYVFFGGVFGDSRIEGVHANYIGTFLYGQLVGTSVIQHCAIFFSRFFIANFAMTTKDSTQEICFLYNVKEKEIGSTTQCSYGGKSYVGYEEDYLGAKEKFNAVVDSRIQDNYISSNKWRGIAFYDCQFSHSNIINNFIEFCFVAFYGLQNQTTNICNNILDYNFVNFSGVFQNTRIVSNTINKCHSDGIFKVQGLFMYPWNDIYTNTTDYCKLLAKEQKATTFFPHAGWFGFRNMIITDNYCRTGERFFYYETPVQRTKHFFVERNVLDDYNEGWATGYGFQVYTGVNNPIENDCTDIHIQFWNYREYNDHNDFPEFSFRPLDSSGKTMLYHENSMLLDKKNNILYIVCGNKLSPINTFMVNNQYGCGGSFSQYSDGGFVFNKFNNQFSFMIRPDNINYLSDGRINWSTKGSDRPNIKSIKEGFTFYDSNLKKMILFNGADWVNLDGSSL